MNQNKTTKYFKYAIGEIILVVVGILIALYLNNQQEAYTIQKQQENYLRQIRGEMINNLKSVEIEMAELSQKINNAYKVLKIMNDDSLIEAMAEPDISKLIFELQKTDNVLFYENGALNQIIYSGGLKEISNDNISALLASWEGKINRVRLQEKQVAEAQENLETFLYQHGDFRSLSDDLGYSEKEGMKPSDNRKGNKSLLRSKEYENYVFQLIAYGVSLKKYEYADFENEMQTLIILINQELDTKK
ncbi:MAG: hypothetical protein ACJART_000435 [Maribacter sp.]|jgi:hypothetical protein